MSAARIGERLRDIDRRRRALLDELGSLDASWLEARPLEGKWSILEIVEHLVLSETATLERLDRAGGVEEAPATPRGLKDRVMYRVVMFILGTPSLKVRVPTRSMVPEGTRSLDELRATWDASQTRLRELVEGLDDEALRRPVLRHAVAGPMSVAQAVAMLDVHLDRHAGQIRDRIRLLNG